MPAHTMRWLSEWALSLNAPLHGINYELAILYHRYVVKVNQDFLQIHLLTCEGSDRGHTASAQGRVGAVGIIGRTSADGLVGVGGVCAPIWPVLRLRVAWLGLGDPAESPSTDGTTQVGRVRGGPSARTRIPRCALTKDPYEGLPKRRLMPRVVAWRTIRPERLRCQETICSPPDRVVETRQLPECR